VANALDILERIASLSVGFGKCGAAARPHSDGGRGGRLRAKQWYGWAMERFAASPFYVHAAALVLVALALQSLGGRGAAPFVYSRF